MGSGQEGCSGQGTGIWLVDFEGMCLGVWGSALGFVRGLVWGCVWVFGSFVDRFDDLEEILL